MNQPLKIFIIYAREDSSFKDGLMKHLTPLERPMSFKVWHDGCIMPGEKWDTKIRENLLSADIVLALISTEFFHSNYIQETEIESAFKRHAEGKAEIIPIIARSCLWKDFDTRLSHIQALPKDAIPIDLWTNKDLAYTDITESVKRLILNTREKANLAKKTEQERIAVEELKKKEATERESQRLENEKHKQEKEDITRKMSLLAKEMLIYNALDIKQNEITEGIPRKKDLLQRLSDITRERLIRPEMVEVKGGNFLLEGKIDVILSDFKISKYPVTSEEYIRYCEVNKISKPFNGYVDDNKCPVINVSWFDAVHYCNWLSNQFDLLHAYKINNESVTLILGNNGFRLPTEAEWEFAARGGQKSRGYRFSGSNNADEVAWYKNNTTVELSRPIGLKKPNELGIYDMSGNVWEWCWDWFFVYPDTKQINPKGPDTGNVRVLRGGNWNSDLWRLDVSYRECELPERRMLHGFRLAQNA